MNSSNKGLILEKINKMAHKNVKNLRNSPKNNKEIPDEARILKKKLIFIEKNLRNEEEFLEFSREKLKNPEFSLFYSKFETSKEEIIENPVKISKKLKFTRKSEDLIKNFNSDLAFVTKLKKIDREQTAIENVKDLHLDYIMLKSNKLASFKQNQCFQNDKDKFHFLTTTKAFEYGKCEKFKKNTEIFTNTSLFKKNASLFTKNSENTEKNKYFTEEKFFKNRNSEEKYEKSRKTEKKTRNTEEKDRNCHRRAKTSYYRIKTGGNVDKKGREHVRLLLRMTEEQIESCRSAAIGGENNGDYSVLF